MWLIMQEFLFFVGEWVACSVGANFTPHIITVNSGEVINSNNYVYVISCIARTFMMSMVGLNEWLHYLNSWTWPIVSTRFGGCSLVLSLISDLFNIFRSFMLLVSWFFTLMSTLST